ncbi:hypothetical protein [Plastoroseomonas arctica]|uniref:hypothetical protein n=1 Tax=Plastoroseomonas arctica TaxID=1509237 RepID=UPI001BAB3ADC|nr:hypothetical protein [Plastoroseomonas arctica]
MISCDGDPHQLAAAEKINSSYVSLLLRLTLLAPNIVQTILDGRQPAGMTLPALMEPFPVEWERQRKLKRAWVVRLAEHPSVLRLESLLRELQRVPILRHNADQLCREAGWQVSFDLDP